MLTRNYGLIILCNSYERTSR